MRSGSTQQHAAAHALPHCMHPRTPNLHFSLSCLNFDHTGSTTHVIDLEKGRVVKHIEAWETEPQKVMSQLFKPAAKVLPVYIYDIPRVACIAYTV